MVAEEVLAKVPGEHLSIHVVWMPVLEADDEASAHASRALLSDPRVKHYWTPVQDLGTAYGKVVRLPNSRELAWDIYFAYRPGVTWEELPPAPDAWVHQLGRDDGHLGDGSGLRESVQRFLREATQ